MTLRNDRRNTAGRRGRARGIDGQRVRRDTQAGTTLEDFGPEFTLSAGKIRVRMGAGLQVAPGTGELAVELVVEPPLVRMPDGRVMLSIASSRGLRTRGGALELVEMEPVLDVDDSTGGTADGTLAAISGSGADTAINNNFADLAAKLNELLAQLRLTDRLRG